MIKTIADVARLMCERREQFAAQVDADIEARKAHYAATGIWLKDLTASEYAEMLGV